MRNYTLTKTLMKEINELEKEFNKNISQVQSQFEAWEINSIQKYTLINEFLAAYRESMYDILWDNDNYLT